MSFKPGDWVTSYSKGIYRVERIIDEYYDESDRSILGDNTIGDKHKERTIVSKRLLNSKLKKSISYESCNEFFISNLSTPQYLELEKIIRENPKLLQELDEFQIPPITTIYNFNLQIDSKSDFEKTLLLVEYIQTGRTFIDIENEMQRLDILKLKPRNFGNYILQFSNLDYECIDKRKIWCDANLIKNG